MIIKNINSIESVVKTDSIRVSKTVSFIPIFCNNTRITAINNRKKYKVIFPYFNVKYVFSSSMNDVYPINTIKKIHKEKVPEDISQYWNIVNTEVKIKGTIDKDTIIVNIEHMNKTYERLYNKLNK